MDQTEAREQASAVEVEVYCGECDAAYGTLRVGPVDGLLGLLASRKARWCETEGQLVSVTALNQADELAGTEIDLGTEALDRPVALRLASEIAMLAEKSTCPECDGDLDSDHTVVRGLEIAISKLSKLTRSPLPATRCPRCQKTALVAERSS